jgi:hypothetical protein
MKLNFLKKKTKEVNSIEDINFSAIESEDIQWLLETLHTMPREIHNDMTLGGAVRKFFLKIDAQNTKQLEDE